VSADAYRAPPRSKFIQLAVREYDLYALDDEGTVWLHVRMGYDNAGQTVYKWQPLNMERIT